MSWKALGVVAGAVAGGLRGGVGGAALGALAGLVVGGIGDASIRKGVRRSMTFSVGDDEVPSGWKRLSTPLTAGLIAKAQEILHSNAPMGSMTPFEHEGRRFGALVTVHPGTTRAVEIWEPAAS